MKNKNAAELVKLRWDKTNEKERSDYAKKISDIRWSKDKKVIPTTSVASLRMHDSIQEQGNT